MKFLQFESFTPRLNETFRLGLGAGGIDMVLRSVQKLPARPFRGQVRDTFRLHFSSPHPIILPQGLYPFENEALGSLNIFIAAVARERDGIIYEAIFN
jgi:hypothetical protein